MKVGVTCALTTRGQVDISAAGKVCMVNGIEDGRLEQRLGRRKRMGSDGACHVFKDGKGWQRYMLDVFGY